MLSHRSVYTGDLGEHDQLLDLIFQSHNQEQIIPAYELIYSQTSTKNLSLP